MEKKIFFIAEIGINHNGDINIAKKLINNERWAQFLTKHYDISFRSTCLVLKINSSSFQVGVGRSD